MIYNTMKKLIVNAIKRYSDGLMGEEEYTSYKESTQRKLDVFYANGRLAESQYDELSGMWT